MGRAGEVTDLWTFSINTYSNSSPALADLDDDGLLEVVVAARNEALYALNGEDGSILWSYSIALGGNSSAPMVGDIQGDQNLEVVFASDDTLYAFEGESGGLIWSQPINPATAASPCLADLNGDGSNEVIFGEYSQTCAYDGETGSILWTSTGQIQSYGSSVAEDVDNNGTAEVMVLTSEGGDLYFTLVSGLNGSEIWSSQLEIGLGVVLTSSPAFADINNDGSPEIISCFGDNDLYVYNPLDGTVIWHEELPEIETYASPVLGDIDGNDSLEVIVTSYSAKEMYAYSCLGDLIWTASVNYRPLGTAGIVDIDGDSALEIIQTSANSDGPYVGSLQIFNAETGAEEFSRQFSSMIGASPAVGDLDGDGYYDFVFGDHDGSILAFSMVEQGIEPDYSSGSLHLSVDQNPVKTNCTISFVTSYASYTNVAIYDLSGREVSSLCQEILPAGAHSFTWDAKYSDGVTAVSGMYICRVVSEEGVQSIGLCLLR